MGVKAISPVIATLILIAIAVIAGVFVLRQFILLSGTSVEQNVLEIQDAVLYRTIKYYPQLGENRLSVTLQISIKNVGQRVVTIKNITVDGLSTKNFQPVSLNPGQVFSGTYTVFKNAKYNPKWDTGTEHTVEVYYQVLGQPAVQKVATKAAVQ